MTGVRTKMTGVRTKMTAPTRARSSLLFSLRVEDTFLIVSKRRESYARTHIRARVTNNQEQTRDGLNDGLHPAAGLGRTRRFEPQLGAS
jgi:hypothetical protein